jgi:hypothetical protein
MSSTLISRSVVECFKVYSLGWRDPLFINNHCTMMIVSSWRRIVLVVRGVNLVQVELWKMGTYMCPSSSCTLWSSRCTWLTLVLGDEILEETHIISTCLIGGGLNMAHYLCVNNRCDLAIVWDVSSKLSMRLVVVFWSWAIWSSLLLNCIPVLLYSHQQILQLVLFVPDDVSFTRTWPLVKQTIGVVWRRNLILLSMSWVDVVVLSCWLWYRLFWSEKLFHCSCCYVSYI